jgi:predicted permease
MFFTSFKVTISAILEIFIIGLVGFVLVKRKLLSKEGLDNLSRLVIFITLPLLIICRFIQDFDFQSYPKWWL